MLSWDDGLLEMIVPDDGYEIVGVISYFFYPYTIQFDPE